MMDGVCRSSSQSLRSTVLFPLSQNLASRKPRCQCPDQGVSPNTGFPPWRYYDNDNEDEDDDDDDDDGDDYYDNVDDDEHEDDDDQQVSPSTEEK